MVELWTENPHEYMAILVAGGRPATGLSQTLRQLRRMGMETTNEPRAKTLAFQGVANVIIRALLRVPLLSRVVGARLMTIYVIGRKSGRTYRVPVAYTRDGDTLVVGTPFGWGRNLRTGDPVTIRFKGRRSEADVQVITDEDGVVAQYALMSRDNKQFAKFNGIGFDEHGEPLAADLTAGWAAGARAFRLVPH
jgi:deazaflavin-dependent oxidoreductase (nitroreductase family)